MNKTRLSLSSSLLLLLLCTLNDLSWLANADDSVDENQSIVLGDTANETSLGSNSLFSEGNNLSRKDFWKQNKFAILAMLVLSMALLALAIGLAIVDRKKDKRRSKVAAAFDEDPMLNSV